MGHLTLPRRRSLTLAARRRPPLHHPPAAATPACGCLMPPLWRWTPPTRWPSTLCTPWTTGRPRRQRHAERCGAGCVAHAHPPRSHGTRCHPAPQPGPKSGQQPGVRSACPTVPPAHARVPPLRRSGSPGRGGRPWCTGWSWRPTSRCTPSCWATTCTSGGGGPWPRRAWQRGLRGRRALSLASPASLWQAGSVPHRHLTGGPCTCDYWGLQGP